MSKYYFFYASSHPLSNFYHINGDPKFTSEHIFHMLKAVTFRDIHGINLVRKADTPRRSKNLGKQISNFKDSTWDELKYDCMLVALSIKFNACPEFRSELENTKDLHIVEASPIDNIWGIGFSEEDALQNISKWGVNLLGQCLMELRKEKFNAVPPV